MPDERVANESPTKRSRNANEETSLSADVSREDRETTTNPPDAPTKVTMTE